MTAYKMAVSGKFSDKSILLIDAYQKKVNDRTWCFWQAGRGNWDQIVYRNWSTAVFANEHFRRDLNFDGYRYKMIRGVDFYNHVFAELAKYPNITFVSSQVINFEDTGAHVIVNTDTESYTCKKLLNSIYDPVIPLSQNKYPVLQQHFIGWHVKTESAIFDADRPTFMDFSIPQKGNTRFMYVLPLSANEAIVEYTLFSKELLPKEEYETAIKDYLLAKNSGRYSLVDTEKGSIPMTSYPFWDNNTKNVLHIGSAGGWTKASTGYTFRNADKKSDALISFLISGRDVSKFHRKNRFWYYDLLLLDILFRTNYMGSQIFSSMFKDGNAAPIFKFLDEETTLTEDIKIINKCPKAPFLLALTRNIRL